MTLAVLRKDLVSLWATPVPYVVAAVFQSVLGILMVNQLQVRGQAVIQPLFPLAGFLLLLVLPVLTMRSFAEEARTGTLDLLLAVPVRVAPLVLGKWLAATLTALVVLAPAGVFAVLLSVWGSPDRGPFLSGSVGLVLLVAAVSGLGTATSACTSSQPIAAMTALFVAVVLWFAHVGGEALGSETLLGRLSLSERLRLFAAGAIDTGDVGFFACFTAATLVVATTVVGLRRQR